MDPGAQIRVLCIGAHPDDCELKFGGTGAKLAGMGHAVKFLSVTNGDAGHHLLGREELATVRASEVSEAAERLGIAASEALPNHDGEVLPSIELRNELVRQIRSWNADVVLTHRPYDYHPDHRYTSQLVQDSAYMVLVPNVCPETPPLRTNPIYMYLEDEFQKPLPFTPDVAVDIDCAWERKLAALDAHSSQFYEWLPWIDGRSAEVPATAAERRAWLAENWTSPLTAEVRAALRARYGESRAQTIVRAEAFELCEYGRRPSPRELDQIFPR
jgi:LmbE family N-acetylglucosaminyl deacetylase